jgi:hypothetical protein
VSAQGRVLTHAAALSLGEEVRTMKAYLQVSTFADALRVRVQDDQHGRFVNVHFDSSAGGAYLSLDPATAERLAEELVLALEELTTRRRDAGEPLQSDG